VRNPCHCVDQKNKRAKCKGNNRKETPSVKKKGQGSGRKKGGNGSAYLPNSHYNQSLQILWHKNTYNTRLELEGMLVRR
jgi:hypothetical protein